VEIENKDYFVDADYGVGPFPVSERFNRSFLTTQYEEVVGPESELRIIVSAYTNTFDDSDYDLSNLRDIQQWQERFLDFLNFTLFLVMISVAAYLVLFVGIRVRHNRN
jgi:hypothetical protein